MLECGQLTNCTVPIDRVFDCYSGGKMQRDGEGMAYCGREGLRMFTLSRER